MKQSKTRWLTHIMLIVFCLVFALPAIYTLLMATLTTQQAITVPPEFFPTGQGIFDKVDHFTTNIETLMARGFDSMILNTIIVALVVVIGKTAMAMLAGVVFVFYDFPGKIFLFFFILLTLLMPTEIIIQPLIRIMADLQWVNTNPRLALTMPFLASAVGVFLFRQHFNNIPRELADAAQIDGASSFRFLIAILLPMSWNVIGAHAMIQFISMWNQYIWPVLLPLDTQNQMIQVGVVQSATVGGQATFNLLMTAGIIASLPPLILFVLLQKQFMSGFAITRDK